MADFLVPRRQGRGKGVGHTAAPASCRGSRWRQPTAMRTTITTRNLCGTPVADLASVDFLEGADAAGLLDVA